MWHTSYLLLKNIIALLALSARDCYITAFREYAIGAYFW